MVLFVINDAGPAKYISLLLKDMKLFPYKCLASNISANIFNKYNIKYILDDNELIIETDLIVTDSSFGYGIDNKWIQIGKQNNIKTISIIEHWSLYKKRFELNGKYIFPDVIFVNDNIARNEAILDGIDKNIIQVVGNPVFEHATKIEYSIDIKNTWKKELCIGQDKRIITFISEEYRKDFPKGSQEYQGFDEFEVLDDIVKFINDDMILLIKLHPAEDKNKYDYLDKYNNIKVIDRTDINKLIEFSDIFIGMGSMLLLEASLIKNNVYSYRPNETIQFIGNKNGMTIYIKNIEELKDIMENKNIKQARVTKNNFIGSTNKILKFIQGYQR